MERRGSWQGRQVTLKAVWMQAEVVERWRREVVVDGGE
jgi:hypothetical protein